MRIDQLPVASSINSNNTLPVNLDGATVQASIGFLTNAIRDNVYGAPLTASTSSAMTDQTRVYVYTGTTSGGFTKGHWYYYNGSAWTDGGAYNSSAVTTDTTLTLSGVPADAKATGDAFTAQSVQWKNNADLAAGNNRLDALLTEVGAILWADGTERNTSTFSGHRRTPYIYLSKGSVLDISGLINITANAALAVYTTAKAYSQANSIRGDGSTYAHNQTFIMPFDGYIRIGIFADNASTTVIKDVTLMKTVNMLVLGNSFSQDSFAYVPKVFSELGTKYRLNIVVGYIGSASLDTHISAINNNTAYDFVDEWSHTTTAWLRYAKGGSSEKTASALLGMYHWDIIYVQPTGGISTDASIITNAVTPAKALLRLLRTQLGYGFTYACGQWLASQDSMTRMAAAMALLDSRVGFNWVFPIGTGIANARSNTTFAALGDSGNMLYDNTHQQSGIPALISAYVIVQSMLQLLGIDYESIYKSTFTPTNANCIAINAYKEGGMTTPLPMTHGDSVGVTDANVLAAKQIASIAARNPYVISDCSDILV